MGQVCCHFEEWDHLSIVTSYNVKKDSPLALPCCNSKKEYVERDTEKGASQVNNLDELFDDVDKIVSTSALTPFINILPVLFGAICHGIMAAYEVEGYYYWMPWVFPNILLVQPIWWYYHSRRQNGLRGCINRWNR